MRVTTNEASNFLWDYALAWRIDANPAPVPIPPAAWLFATGVIGLLLATRGTRTNRSSEFWVLGYGSTVQLRTSNSELSTFPFAPHPLPLLSRYHTTPLPLVTPSHLFYPITPLPPHPLRLTHLRRFTHKSRVPFPPPHRHQHSKSGAEEHCRSGERYCRHIDHIHFSVEGKGCQS